MRLVLPLRVTYLSKFYSQFFQLHMNLNCLLISSILAEMRLIGKQSLPIRNFHGSNIININRSVFFSVSSQLMPIQQHHGTFPFIILLNLNFSIILLEQILKSLSNTIPCQLSIPNFSTYQRLKDPSISKGVRLLSNGSGV